MAFVAYQARAKIMENFEQVGLLGRIAVYSKLISMEELSKATKMQSDSAYFKKLGECFIELGFMDEQKLEWLLDVQKKYLGRMNTNKSSRTENYSVKVKRNDLEILLQQAVEKKASDIHFHSNSPYALRINGKLIPEGESSFGIAEIEQLLFNALVDDQRKQLE